MKIEISIALNFLIAYLYNKLPRRRVNMLGEQMHKYLHIKYQDHWYPERPTKGSAYRSIRISKEKIDKILINATVDVNLNLQEILDSLPNDLTIWIDPGEVSYRIGEKEPVQILYADERNLIRHTESSSDTDEISHHESTISIQPFNHNMQILQSNDTMISLSPVMDSDFVSWSNSISTPILSIQTFAQTRFGSLKIKQNGQKNSIK